MSTTPNWEELFNKQSTCSNCGETAFMCDCRNDDIPDYDSDEEDDY